MTYLSDLSIGDKKLQFPVFFPDATKGVIRSLDRFDLEKTKIEGLIVNTYHLMNQPGTTVIKMQGGIKSFMNWDKWIISDSGGFQLLSMIYQDPSFGSINSKGVTFNKRTQGKLEKQLFTPEKSIQVQFSLGSDILICLDDCPSLNASTEDTKVSVNRTIEWAKRCKEEFCKQLSLRKIKESNRPLLFAVIQGGNDKNERERCAKALLEIGFDGYSFGGWPLIEPGVINYDILSFTASLMPNDSPKYALGVGNPQAIIDCVKMGYNIFDTVLPTRDARHQRLYVFSQNPDSHNFLQQSNLFSFIHILREKYVRDTSPISQFCDCHTCQNYSKAYLHHLFKIEDSLASRLATIHNLRTYSKLIEVLRTHIFTN